MLITYLYLNLLKILGGEIYINLFYGVIVKKYEKLQLSKRIIFCQHN